VERLTWFDKQGVAKREINCKKCPSAECKGAVDCKNTAVNRLASIEDILGDDYDLDRLRELIEADRAGRCVVLPCKKGDILWSFHSDYEEIYPVIVYNVASFNSQVSINTDRYVISSDDIGKIVFLTREEAKAALRRMQDG
jgi:hypothetical protein